MGIFSTVSLFVIDLLTKKEIYGMFLGNWTGSSYNLKTIFLYVHIKIEYI